MITEDVKDLDIVNITMYPYNEVCMTTPYNIDYGVIDLKKKVYYDRNGFKHKIDHTTMFIEPCKDIKIISSTAMIVRNDVYIGRASAFDGIIKLITSRRNKKWWKFKADKVDTYITTDDGDEFIINGYPRRSDGRRI